MNDDDAIRTVAPTDTPDSVADVDELLAALDEFANAVHWLRRRTDYQAATALGEALTDWTAGHGTDPSDGVGTPALALALAALGAAVPDPAEFGTALTAAISEWTAAISAEHHRSQPFQHRRT